jgi:hypothetical protein
MSMFIKDFQRRGIEQSELREGITREWALKSVLNSHQVKISLIFCDKASIL